MSSKPLEFRIIANQARSKHSATRNVPHTTAFSEPTLVTKLRRQVLTLQDENARLKVRALTAK